MHTREELIEALEAFEKSPEPVATVDEGERRLVMVFTGQGTQWAGCGRALYDADTVFRRVVDAIEEHWREHSDISLREASFTASQSELNECELAQPVTFMIQCALAELFKTWGVYPDCVVGHSSGEIAAAYVCGALSLAEATRLIFHRATLQQRTAGSGRMLAIGLDRPGVEQLLEMLGVPFRTGEDQPAQVEIACENAPASTVICGKEAVLRPIMEELNRRHLQNQLLQGNIAFHSSAMDPLKEDAQAALSFLDDCAFDADVPLVSSVTGQTTQRLDSAYWWANIRQTVRFAEAVETVKREYRPDVFLELAPHSALQTTLAQCLEDSVTVPVCIPTLMRDSDACLGFKQALGALFRAGVDLDFAAQYPRSEPIVHLLPGHPREEQTTMDIMCDNEMFVRQGEYSHGPLVGHRVPCDELLFEARLSEKDFPWLADHRVHHAPIMPAAGYIELILEALQEGPVHFEEIEFLQPCPIPKTAVRLQTALHPVANTPDEFTFTISSRSYAVGTEGSAHCRGRVRRISDHLVPGVPERLADVDTSGCNLVPLMSGPDFYEHVEGILGDAFHYGSCFQTNQGVEVDIAAKVFRFDVAVEEELWTTGQEEGFVVFPALLDGGLQIFLHYLMRKSDLFAIPQRARRLTFVRPPTSSRMTCHVAGGINDLSGTDERGQFTIPLGEISLGSISFYDSATGLLVAHIDQYCSFNSNPRWNDLPHSKHMLSWQPKFIPAGQALVDRLPDGEIDPAALIATLEQPGRGWRYACHVVEFAGCREPDQTVLKQCIDYLASGKAQTEFWLISDNEEVTRSSLRGISPPRRRASVRLPSIQPRSRNWIAGLLRPGAAEILFLHEYGETLGPEKWALVSRLAVAGGLALVSHGEGEVIEPGRRLDHGSSRSAGARPCCRRRSHTEMLLIPWNFRPRDGCWANREAGRRIGRPCLMHRMCIEFLMKPLPPTPSTCLKRGRRRPTCEPSTFFAAQTPRIRRVKKWCRSFIAFIQALVWYRIEHAKHLCRLTVLTRRAVCEVDDPRGSGLWGAVRSMAAEVGEEAKIDFRLVDLGDTDDLETLASARWV